MTDHLAGREGIFETSEESEAGRLRWDVPELCAVAVLAATTLLIIAGLATGVVASTASLPGAGPLSGDLLVGSAIQRGAFWANPLLGFALLAVILLCWWRAGTWTEVIGATTGAEPVDEALGRMWRSRQIGVWVQWALVLNFVGAVGFLVGAVLYQGGIANEGSQSWTTYLSSGGSALAVLVVSCCGLFVGTRISERYWSIYDHVAGEDQSQGVSPPEP